jgi:cystathionine beta-lyase
MGILPYKPIAVNSNSMAHNKPMDSFGAAELSTRLLHLGEEKAPHGAVVPPLYQNSLFLFQHSADLLAGLEKTAVADPYVYSRIGNPTIALLEQKLAALEGTAACKVTGCGMAAITAAVLSQIAAGSHVIVPDTAYGPVRSLLNHYLEHFGISVTTVSGTCTDEVLDAITPETTLIYLESPSSVVFRMQDLAPIAAEARRRKITTVIDNTYNAGLHLRPAEHGIDLICHSLTKYVNGHSDMTGGAICGSAELIGRITKHEVNLLGNVLHPFPAWLALRGLRTLPLRLKQHESTGNAIARFLASRPEVERVHHVGLESHPQREWVTRYLKGSGGLLSFEPVNQSKEAVFAFCDSLKWFGRGISWGGHESLVVPLPSHHDGPAKWVIRLFGGLEDPKDLIQDLAQAFDHLRT